MHFDSDNRWPRYHSSGNLVFGGLPASCGPEVAVQHVIAIGRLGQIVGSQEHLSERNVREHVDRFNAQLEADQDVTRAMRCVSTRRHGEPVTLDGVSAEAEPFAERLAQHIFDDAIWTGQDHRIVNEVDWEYEMRALVQFLGGPAPKLVGSLLKCVDSVDAKYWRLPLPWDAALLARADSVPSDHLLHGLHELHRMPWSSFGGMIAGRGATDDYLAALQQLNRDVLIAYVVHEWHLHADAQIRWLAESLTDLMGCPFRFECLLTM